MALSEKDLKISIIIPTCNRRDSLLRTVKGVLQQQYDRYEMIIVDDHSGISARDDVAQLCEPHHRAFQYIYHKQNEGAGASRKDGYLLASGDIIIFSDDDDYYTDPLYFQKLNQIFQKNPDTLMVCANVKVEDEIKHTTSSSKIFLPDGITNRQYLNGFFYKYQKPDSSLAMALSQKKISTIPYRNLTLFNDTSLYLYALLSEGRVRVIQDFIGVYCIHGGNMSAAVKPEFIISNLDSKMDIYKEACRRKLLDKPDEWLYIQLLITIKYYFDGKSGGFRQDMKLYRWVWKNMRGEYRAKLCLKMCPGIIKNVGKRVIRKKAC